MWIAQQYMSSKDNDNDSSQKEIDEMKIINLMSSADAVMSHWQVSQAFMRMARRSKKKEIKAAFLQAEQQIISDLFKALTQSQLNEKRKDSKLSASAALRERPSELSRLGEYFPLSLLSLYTYARTWNVVLFCDKCRKFVRLTDLRIFELCARHHECVALHCVPVTDQLQASIDPLGMMDRFRKSAMMKSEDDKTGEGKNETFFDHSLYDDLTHNMSTIAQLVQMRSVSFNEEDYTPEESHEPGGQITASLGALEQKSLY
jgi:hypothetical protein